MNLKKSLTLMMLSLAAPALLGQEKAIDRDAVMKAVVEKYDTNRDGQLDQTERAVILMTFDLDGSGDLDKNEKLAVAKAVSGQPNSEQEAALPMTQDLGSHGLAQEQIDSLAENFRKSVEKQAIAGCAFLIAHKGEIVFREAFGFADLDSERPFTTDELVPIASVSKPLAASVIMALVEQGKLNLDDSVAQYLPEFKGIKIEGTETAAGPITIRHLLSHTGGFWGNKNITPEKVALIRNFERPLAEAVSEMAAYELLSEPGTKYQYSGAGYCVVGRVAEVALNQSFEEISQNALFRPLGMGRTTFLPSPEIRRTVPTAYQKKDGKLQKTLSVSNVEDLQFILPGGSLFTTIDELAVFGQMQLNNGELNGKRFLSGESIAEMRRLQTPQKGPKTYGLGWFRDKVTDSDLAEVTYHNGALGAHLRIDRRREVVTVFFVHQTAGPFAELLNRRNQFVNEMFPIPEDH